MEIPPAVLTQRWVVDWIVTRGHVLTGEQARNMAKALWHGDPDRSGVIRQAFRQVLGG